MNTKKILSTVFILFLIFSSIGCISESTPDGDVILNKEHQSQWFTVVTPSSEVEWFINDKLVETDIRPGNDKWNADYFLVWTDLPQGTHVLEAHTWEMYQDWTIEVQPYVEYIIEQENIKLQEERFSWINAKNEWQEKADKLMTGEEI